MKTLNAVQTLSKIGKILSKIVYICCIVGFCGCVAGILAMFAGAETVKLGGVTLHSILETEADVSVGSVWAAIAVGMILCVGEFFVARMAHRYFEHELNAGTPFTLDGAKELLRLGISVVWIPIATTVLAQVTQGVMAQCMENVETLNLEGFDSVTLGVMLILMSLLCKYGAECKENGESKQGEQHGC